MSILRSTGVQQYFPRNTCEVQKSKEQVPEFRVESISATCLKISNEGGLDCNAGRRRESGILILAQDFSEAGKFVKIYF